MRDITFIIANAKSTDIVGNLKPMFSDYFKKVDFLFISNPDTPKCLLYNIAVQHCATEYIAFIDENVRVNTKFNPIKVYECNNAPYVTFNKVNTGAGTVNNKNSLFLFMKRSDFVNVNGFSNLCTDDEVNTLILLSKFGDTFYLDNCIEYIDELIECEPDRMSTEIYDKYNRGLIDPKHDGMKQLMCTVIRKKINRHIKFLIVSNVEATHIQ